MTGFEAAFADARAERARQPAAQNPATLGEVWRSEWRASGLDTLIGVGAPWSEAYGELENAFRQATGETVFDAARRQGVKLPTSSYDARVDGVRQLMGGLDPSQAATIEPFLDVRGRARSKAASIEKEARETRDRTFGLLAGAVGFVAGVARQAVDPVNLATLPFGAARGASVLRMLGTEAGVGFATQAVQEPVIQAGRAELGLEAGFGQGLVNSLEAGVGAAGFAGILRGAGFVLRKGWEASVGAADAPDLAASPETRLNATATTFDPRLRDTLAELAPEDFEAVARVVERDTLIDATAPIASDAGRMRNAEHLEIATRAIETGRVADLPDMLADRRLEPLGLPVPAMPTHRVATSDGRAIEVEPRVVELADLIASSDPGYDPLLQPRDRARAASQAQIREIATRIEPLRLGTSAEADRGAPIIGPDRMVESGNGRVMALRLAYEQGGEAIGGYRAWLSAQGVDVAGFAQPVIVRERLTPLSPDGRADFAIAANRSAILTMSAPERALSDGRLVTPDMLGLIRNADDLSAAANRDFMRAFIAALPPAEHGALADGAGRLSAEGMMRARNAVLASAYGDARLLSRIAEATADDIKSISNGLVAAAPQWATLRAEIAAARVPSRMDRTPALMEAVTRTSDLRSKGIKLQDALDQIDAFAPIGREVEAFMQMFYVEGRAASAERVAKALRFYADEAKKVSSEMGLDLGLAPVQPRELLDAARSRQAGDTGRQPDLLGDRPGAGAGDAPAGAGGERPGAGEPGPAARDAGDRAAGDAGQAAAADGVGDSLLPPVQPSRAPQLGQGLDLDATPEAAARFADIKRELDARGDLDLFLETPDGQTRKVSARAHLEQLTREATAASELRACLGGAP